MNGFCNTLRYSKFAAWVNPLLNVPITVYKVLLNVLIILKCLLFMEGFLFKSIQYEAKDKTMKRKW